MLHRRKDKSEENNNNNDSDGNKTREWEIATKPTWNAVHKRYKKKRKTKHSEYSVFVSVTMKCLLV